MHGVSSVDAYAQSHLQEATFSSVKVREMPMRAQTVAAGVNDLWPSTRMVCVTDHPVTVVVGIVQRAFVWEMFLLV